MPSSFEIRMKINGKFHYVLFYQIHSVLEEISWSLKLQKYINTFQITNVHAMEVSLFFRYT